MEASRSSHLGSHTPYCNPTDVVTSRDTWEHDGRFLRAFDGKLGCTRKQRHDADGFSTWRKVAPNRRSQDSATFSQLRRSANLQSRKVVSMPRRGRSLCWRFLQLAMPTRCSPNNSVARPWRGLGSRSNAPADLLPRRCRRNDTPRNRSNSCASIDNPAPGSYELERRPRHPVRDATEVHRVRRRIEHLARQLSAAAVVRRDRPSQRLRARR